MDTFSGETRRIENLRELAKHRNGYMRGWAVSRLGLLGGSAAVHELVTAVSDPFDEVVVQACVKLRDYLPKAAVEPLIKVLSHKNPTVVSNAALALGAIGDPMAVGPLMKLLKSHDSRIRGAAASALGSFKQNRVKKILLNLLNTEKDWYVSVEVIQSLGRLRCIRALKTMVQEMISVQDTITHNHMLHALADFTGSREIYSLIESQDMALEVLAYLLPEAEKYALPEVQKARRRLKYVLATKNARRRLRRLYEAALDVLKAEINWVGAEGPEFYRRLKDYDDILCACQLLLRRLTRAEIDAARKDWVEARNILAFSTFLRVILRIEELQRVEEDAEEAGRSAAKLIKQLKRTGEKKPVKLIHGLVRRGFEVEDTLIKILKMDEGYPSHYATEILGRMGSMKAVPALIKALSSDDWMLNEQASDALARIGEPALDAVEVYLKRKTKGKIYACYSLAVIGGDRALTVLLGLLKKPRGILKASIVGNLGELGDARAIEPLRKLIRSDPSFEVREEAKTALLDLCRMHGIKVPELKELETEDEEFEKKLEIIRRSGTRGRSPLADFFEPTQMDP